MVNSGEKWRKVMESGKKWGKVAKIGEKWRKVAKSGKKVRKSGEKRRKVGKSTSTLKYNLVQNKMQLRHLNRCPLILLYAHIIVGNF